MRNVAILAGLVAAPLCAYAIASRQWSESQSATRSAPTLATEGMALSGVTGFRLTACATTGTIATACTLKAWVRNETTGLWTRSASADSTGLGHLDWQILAADAGKACVTFPDQQPVARRGSILYATSGCDALTLYIEGVTQ